jgi:hypothetical protein
VHQDQRVNTTLRNQPGGQHRFAECRRGGQDACIVPKHCLCSRLLFGSQRAAKRNVQRNAAEAFIADYHLDLQFLKGPPHLIETTTREGEMQWVLLRAVDDSRLSVSRKAH